MGIAGEDMGVVVMMRDSQLNLIISSIEIV